MKRTLIICSLIFVILPCRAQWKSAGFGYQVLGLGVHDTDLFVGDVPASASDSLLWRYTTANGWTALGTGIDRTQGNITSFASLGKYFFAGQDDNGVIYRSNNNGLSWIANDSIASPIATNGTYLFAVDAMGISRSMDSGKTWISTRNNLVPNNFAPIGTCVISYTTKGLYRSTDTGGTWNPVTTPISNVSCFAVVGTVIYAANGTQLMVSTDSGAMWTTMTTNFTVAVLATNGVRLFAGGDSGVCMLGTDGATWTNESDTGTLRGHGVVALGVFDTLLFADFVNVNYPYDLYDRSIPEMVDTTKSDVVVVPPGDTLLIYPNPALGIVTVLSGSTSIEQISVLNVLGENVLDMPNLRESNITLDLSKLPSGTYFFEIQTANGLTLRKIILER